MTHAPNLKGYFPVRVTTVKGKPFVKFAKLPKQVFDDPFMGIDPIVQFGEVNNYPSQAFWFDDISSQILREPHLPIKGFIFHLSRCGSTLVAQMLKAFKTCQVVNEPSGIVQFLIRSTLFPEERQLNLKRFKAYITAYAQALGAEKKGLYIKMQEFPLLHMEFIAEAFPKVPWIFLYREPSEIMASWWIKNDVPFLIRQQHGPRSNYVAKLLGFEVDAVQQFSKEEYSALILGRLMDEALKYLKNPHGIALDYQTLPRGFFPAILPHFGFKYSGREAQDALEVARYYSKHKKPKVFVSDRKEKLASITEAMKLAIDQWARPQYELLQRQFTQLQE